MVSKDQGSFCEKTVKYLQTLQASFSPEVITKIEELSNDLLEGWLQGKQVFICGMEEAELMLYTWLMIFIME